MIRIVKGILQSSLLHREIPYRVILPAGYDKFQKRYPVLYLLHGLFGSCDNWLNLTNLSVYASDTELIIVLPEGGDYWYTDSATATEDKFESYFIEELIPEIDLLYKTDEKRDGRAVAGLSMGGYGALKFGLKRPDLFCFAASISGAFGAPDQTKDHPGVDWENLGPSILKAFGEADSQTRTENDLFRIIERIAPEKTDYLSYFYIDCGVEDGFLEVNEKLADLLKEKEIPFEYHENPGGHDWDYWDKRIRQILPLIERQLS